MWFLLLLFLFFSSFFFVFHACMYFLLSVFVSVAAAVIIYLNLPFLLLLCSPPSPSFLHCSSLPEDRAARPVIGYNTQIIKGEVHWILRATWWFLHNTSASATLPLHYKDFLYFFCSSSSYFAVTCLLFYLFFLSRFTFFFFKMPPTSLLSSPLPCFPLMTLFMPL